MTKNCSFLLELLLLFPQLLYGKCNIYSVLNKKNVEGTKGVIIIRKAKKERKTTKWPKEKGQTDKQRSMKR
jgi:hypothetical protein